MNIVLFDPHELSTALPRDDRRAKHVLEVLRRSVGETFDAGVINGPIGKATISQITEQTMRFSFVPAGQSTAAAPITLIIGMPRPQTARDILRDATTLGIATLHFVRTEKGEPSYGQSTLWSSGEWRRHILAGAEQAFDTRIPDVTYERSLGDLITPSASHSVDPLRLALDNYESSQRLSQAAWSNPKHVVLAIGAERGWSAAERDLLRNAGFLLVHLGSRILRTESAVTVALALVRAKLGMI